MTCLSPAFALALLLSMSSHPVTPDVGEDRVDFEIRVLQIDLDAADDLRIGGIAVAHRLVVRSGGDPTGPTVLVLDESRVEHGGRSWSLFDGELEEARDVPFVSISAPRVSCRYEQRATFSIGQPIHYLVRDEAGCLQIETNEETFEGLLLALTPEAPEDDRLIKVRRLRASLSRLASRQPFEDVLLEVGEPVMSSVGLTASFSLTEWQVAVVPMPTWDHEVDPIVIAIRARLVRLGAP